MKKLIFFFLLITLNLFVSGQNFRFALDVGFGSYMLEGLRKVQDKMYFTNLNELNLPIKKIETFPPYFIYSMELEYAIDSNNYAALDASFCSTGARNQIKDYSGEYTFDMLVNAKVIGFHYRRNLFSENGISFFIMTKAGFVFSNLKMNQIMKIYTVVDESEKYKLNGIGYYTEPVGGIRYALNKKVEIKLCLGYQFNFGSKLHLKGDNDSYLYDDRGKKVGADWTGTRLYLGVSYNFGLRMN